MTTSTTSRHAEAAQIIRSQIEIGVLMSLGARQLHTVTDAEIPTFGFIANVTFDGDPRPTKAHVTIALNQHDLYNVTVRAVRKHLAAPETVWRRDDVFVGDLNRLLLSLDGTATRD